MTTETQLAQVPEQPEQPKPAAKPIAVSDRGVQFSSMGDMHRFCTYVANSKLFKGIESPEVALIHVQAGAELGLSPIWSLTNILVVHGRPSVWGDALLGLVLGHPECQDVIESFEGEGDTLTAVCDVRRKGRLPLVRSFSVSDAKKAGLWGKAGPWSAYPKRMLQMRARAFACRDGFADVLRGLSVREEMDDVPMKQVAAREITKVELE